MWHQALLGICVGVVSEQIGYWVGRALGYTSGYYAGYADAKRFYGGKNQ